MVRVPVARAGFTLAEALVAVTLSAVVMGLVMTVFLVQNDLNARQLERSFAQDNARSATEIVGSEVRAAMWGSIAVASRDSFTVRSPMAVTVICDASGSYAYIHFEGGEAELDQGEFGGVALRDSNNEEWFYFDAAWSDLDADGSATAAQRCAANGADTVGIRSDFHTLYASGTTMPPAGTVLMLYRKTTFAIRRSALDTLTHGLFRRPSTGAAVEYASGLDTSAHFEYRRLTRTGWATSVTGASRDSIDAIRFVADTRQPAGTGGRDDITSGWTVDIPLRNVR